MWTVILLVLNLQAQTIICQKPVAAIDKEACSISYQILTKIQRQALKAQIDVDVQALERSLRHEGLRENEVNPENNWEQLTKDQKASQVFRALSKKQKLGELETLKEFKKNPGGIHFSTGTRGGGFDESGFLTFEDIWY